MLSAHAFGLRASSLLPSSDHLIQGVRVTVLAMFPAGNIIGNCYQRAMVMARRISVVLRSIRRSMHQRRQPDVHRRRSGARRVELVYVRLRDEFVGDVDVPIY